LPRHLGGIRFDLMGAIQHHTINLTPPAAALPSVIGGPASDFIAR
jgi:hypothetical protein